ncbi:MAG: hypothetical protein FWD23_17650 [Oscillospiraceae bacterium]|nr:hypothetical protein [Oscillospiraceae bacterium]
MEKELPVRKKIRLQGYDYSSDGAYFITMCIEGRHEMLGQIVGRGILDAPHILTNTPHISTNAPFVELTEYGKNVVEAIKFLNNKNHNINIEKYVIMPNHVHMIIVIHNDSNGGVTNRIKNNSVTNGINSGGASGKPRPTNALIPKHISSIKRFTNKQAGFDMWQDHYHDRIIRDQEEYRVRWQYIENNPAKWAEDDYFVKK